MMYAKDADGAARQRQQPSSPIRNMTSAHCNPALSMPQYEHTVKMIANMVLMSLATSVHLPIDVCYTYL